jgi:hypothetical protein
MSEEHEIQENLEPAVVSAEDTPEPAHEHPSSEAASGVDLDRVRDLVLAAHPEVVPEMVQGENFDELMASVEPAREAYQRILGQMAEKAGPQPAAPKVASQPGRRGAAIADIEGLSPLGKISEGLRRL